MSMRLPILPALIAALAIGPLQPVVSQTYSWKTVEIGGGGFVTGTVFHPNEAGLVYARTDVGGAYRLDTVSQRWIALNDDIGGLNNEFQHLGVLSIGLDPGDPNRVYLATGQYAGTESWKLASRIYRSTDRGATWTYTTPGFKMAGNGEGRGTGERIAVDPVNGANLLVGTSNAGIWRSTDHGATWTRLTSFAPVSCNYLIYAPTSHHNPGPNRRVYAATGTSGTQSFWRSDDNGGSWVEMPGHPGSTAGADMMSLQGSFGADGVFYSTWANATGPANYASRFGVWKLSADATTWTSILPPTGQGFFSGISADPRVPGHVLVSTLLRWWPGDEIYRSTDGGSTWTAALRSGTRSPGNSPWSSNVGAHWITDVDIDPFNSERAIFNNGFGLIQTTNLSATGTSRLWTFFSDGLEELVPLALLSPTAGPPLVSVVGDYTGFRHDRLDRSPLRGSHQPGAGSTGVVSGADLAPEKMIRQNSSSTYRSSDGGASWSTFPSTPAPIINGHNRVIFSADGQRLLWCPPNSPAYVSTDQGATWSPSSTGASLVSGSGLPSVSVLAGAAGQPGSTNATGGDARFQSPSAIALDTSGVRYIADTSNHLIRRVVANGGVNTLAGGAGLPGSTNATGTAARFNAPSGIAVDSNRNVFVSDTGNHTIRKITSSGVVTTLAGNPGVPGSADGTGASATFSSPGQLTLAPNGDLIVCDTGNHTLRRISPSGTVTTFAGSPGSAGTTDATGTAARFNSPGGVVFNAAGELFVADSGNHSIRRISATGVTSTFAGTSGTPGSADGTGTSARFNQPGSITINSAGTLLVADTGNHTIRSINPAGLVTTISGSAGSPGSTNGTGTAARFLSPRGIVSTPDGFNVYVADTGNHTIRRTVTHNTLIPLADRVDGNRFHLWDATLRRLLTSTDGGTSFGISSSGLSSTFAQFRTVPGHAGHLWVRAGANGLHRSTDSGATFTKISTVSDVYQFDFGKAKPGATHPSIFIWGKIGTTNGFFRSDDIGATWTRINDDQHNFGYQNDIAGDPRVHGRVYLATSGRGVVVGEIANAPAPASQASSMVYDDSPSPAWTNASPAGTDITSTNPVRRGTRAIAIPSGTGKSAAFQGAPRSTAGLAALAFWIHGGSGGPPPIQIGGSRGGIALEASPVGIPATSGWQRVLVPLADLGLARIDDLTGLRIESRTLNGISPAAFSLDDIELVGDDDYNQGTPTAEITLSGLSAVYDGNAKAVSATTQPSGLAVTVTYNGATSPPVDAGTYQVIATINDAAVSGSATGTLVIAKAPAQIRLENLAHTADGSPKSATFVTTPNGLSATLTYNGSSSAPILAGTYTVAAVINSPNHEGSASGSLIIRQPALSPTGIGAWASNIAGKVTASPSSPSSPLLVPNDTSDPFSTNTLHGSFSPITLVNEGDRITLTGNLQLSAPAVGGQGNWFRFGIFDNRNQAPSIATGWLGCAGMGNSLYERTGDTGLFSTGTGATQRSPDANPAPVSSTSPSGNPPLSFEVTATRTATGVLITHRIQRTDTNAVLMAYSFTDATPNNNGILTGPVTTSSGYRPTYNTAGFAFSRNYIGSGGATAQFSNVLVSFTPGVTASPQYISFPALGDRAFNSAPFDPGATASSGLPVAYTILSGPATLNGGLVNPTGVGLVTIRATQTGNTGFLPAEDVIRTFALTKAPATITLNGLSTTYIGTPREVTATTSPASLNVLLAYGGTSTPPTAAGTYQISAVIDDPFYQGETTASLVIAKASQSINLRAISARVFGDPPFTPQASAGSGLPVSIEVVSGPASASGNAISLVGAGTVVLRATQTGDANHLPAAPVERSFEVGKAAASVTIQGLSASFDGQPKSVTVTTQPAGLEVAVTYNGSTTPPSAAGSHAVQAIVISQDYQGSASASLVIGPRVVSRDLSGWITTASSMNGADGSSPHWNPTNLANGLSGTAHAFFPSIQLSQAGDSIQLTGTVAIEATGNNPKLFNNKGLWFRFGLFRNPTPVLLPSDNISNWLGYCGMANATPALYERTGSGNYASSITGASSRTPQVVPAGSNFNSTQNSVTLAFTETITRTATGVDVSYQMTNTATGAKVMDFTFSDTTPSNHGLLTGSQNSPLDPVFSPSFSAAGFGFSGEYINGSDTSARFSQVRVTHSSGNGGVPQTITFPSIADRTYADPPFAPSATSSSSLPVAIQVVSGPATIDGGMVALTGTGEVVLRATQAGDFIHLPALPVERSFQIGKAPAAIALGNLLHTHDGLAKTATASTQPPGLTVELRYNGTQSAPHEPGLHEVSATVVDDRYTGSTSGILEIRQASALALWRSTHFGTDANSGNASNNADPDHDGLTNLAEFALGLDPASPSTAPVSISLASGWIEVTFTRLKQAVPEVQYDTEWSDQPGNGTWSTDGVIEVMPTLADDGVRETIRTRVPAGSGKRFVRIRMSTAGPTP